MLLSVGGEAKRGQGKGQIAAPGGGKEEMGRRAMARKAPGLLDVLGSGSIERLKR